MTRNPRRTAPLAPLAQQAAEWVVRLEDQPSAECREEFVSWLRLSAQHVDEFLLAQATYRAFHSLGTAHQVDVRALVASEKSNVTLIGRDREPVTGAPRDRAKSRWPVALAAVLATILIGGAVWYFRAETNTPLYATAIGEQRTIRLDDGSLLFLNARSRASVQFSARSRQVELLEGEALFDVAHDAARPFEVTAGTTAIRVLGTRFNVLRKNGETRVSVVRGRVQVSTPETSGPAAAPLATTLLSAGEEVRVTREQAVTQTQADLGIALAWRERRLVFRGTPLAEVVDEFNRYNARPLRLEGPTLGQRPISGVFHADDPSTILKFLRTEPAIRIEETPEQIVIREE